MLIGLYFEEEKKARETLCDGYGDVCRLGLITDYYEGLSTVAIGRRMRGWAILKGCLTDVQDKIKVKMSDIRYISIASPK